MTNRERILRTLQCLPADRPPFAMWLGFSPWGATLARWRRESGIADLNVRTFFGFDALSRHAPALYGPCPLFDRRVIEETPEHVVSVNEHGLLTRQARDENAMREFIDNPVKDRAGWERYKTERLQPRWEERLAPLAAGLEKERAIDAPLQAGGYPWGVFGTPRDLLGVERLLISFCDDPEMVRDMVETLVSLWIGIYERVAQHAAIDVIHIWEDMAGRQGSLISMRMVEEFMMPQYDRIAAFARRRGVPVISVDSDGLVDELTPVLARHGVNAFYPFEVRAGNDMLEYRKRFPKLGILGGLDKNALAAGKKEMNRELDRAAEMFASGGYVPGFDHSIPPNVPWKNYLYFVNELKKLIGI